MENYAVLSEIQSDFTKLAYSKLKNDFIDDLIKDSKKFFNEVATEKKVIVKPFIEDITVYTFDRKLGPTPITELDNSIKDYKEQIKRIMDHLDNSLKYTGSYDGKHVHMLNFSVQAPNTSKIDDYLVLVTTPRFVKLSHDEKQIITDEFEKAISSNECLKPVIKSIIEGYNNCLTDNPVEIQVSTSVVDYLVVYFDQIKGPVIVSSTDSLDKRIIDESRAADKLKDDVSQLMDLTSSDDKKTNGVYDFRIIGKKNGVYYHTIDFQVPDQTHRGKQAMYALVIATESDDISDNRIRFNEDFFKKGLTAFHDSFLDTMAESSRLLEEHINETKDKSLVVDKNIVMEKLKQTFEDKLKKSHPYANNQ